MKDKYPDDTQFRFGDERELREQAREAMSSSRMIGAVLTLAVLAVSGVTGYAVGAWWTGCRDEVARTGDAGAAERVAAVTGLGKLFSETEAGPVGLDVQVPVDDLAGLGLVVNCRREPGGWGRCTVDGEIELPEHETRDSGESR